MECHALLDFFLICRRQQRQVTRVENNNIKDALKEITEEKERTDKFCYGWMYGRMCRQSSLA